MQNLAGIDSAVTDLCMREKTRFCVDFFFIYDFTYYVYDLSVHLCMHSCVCVCVCVGMMVEALSNWLQKRLNLSRADFATDWPGVPRRPCCNNNNSNSHDNVYGAVIMTKVIARVHLVHLMNVD